jgi:hypothetical protein
MVSGRGLFPLKVFARSREPKDMAEMLYEDYFSLQNQLVIVRANQF